MAVGAQRLSIRSGFDFLKGAANFEIGEVLLPFDSSQPVWLAFLNGVLNTIRVAVFAIITSMVLGAVVGIMRLSNHPILRFLGTAQYSAHHSAFCGVHAHHRTVAGKY